MPNIDYNKLQQEKYYGNHKQYKVYLTTDTDTEIIKVLDDCDNKSAFIRKAIIKYVAMYQR